MTNESLGHLGLFAQCGICDDVILRHERVIALIGDADSTSSRGHTRPFPFPQVGYTLTKVDGYTQCRYPDCHHCAASPEFIPIHCDCCEIFKASCHVEDANVLSRLWTFAAWKKPWRGALPIFLANRGIDMDVLRRTAQLAGFPLLYKLPMELLEMIRGYSQYSLFWRCVSALILASRVSSTDLKPLVTLPLNQVLSWERNGSLKHDTSASLSPGIRLTIDKDGISKAESLSSVPRYSGECYDNLVFVNVPRAAVPRIMVQLRNGLVRLHLAPGVPMPRIWNTPAPLNLRSCSASPAILSTWQRFTSVETDKIRGITFFFSMGMLFGLHIHDSEESSALWAFERFSNRRRRSITWVYLPIPKGDRLLVLGVRKKPELGSFSILARTRLGGDLILGQHIQEGFQDICLAKQAPITFIYSEPRETRPVPFFGAYSHSKPSPDAPLPRRFPVVTPRTNPFSEKGYFSWAPLKGISSACVFYDKLNGLCLGIKFHYDNGRSRVVGQCRLHVDATEWFERPVKFCFCLQSYVDRWDRPSYTAKVAFDHHHHPLHEHDQEWKCHSLRGFVEFWFTNNSSFLSVEN